MESRDQLVNLAPMSSEPVFGLNLQSFQLLCKIRGVEDVPDAYEKVRIIFNVWTKLRDQTRQRMQRLEAATGVRARMSAKRS